MRRQMEGIGRATGKVFTAFSFDKIPRGELNGSSLTTNLRPVMHPFFSFLGDDRDGVIIVDAIPSRLNELDDVVLLERCGNLFSDKDRAVVVLTNDGLAEWHVKSCSTLIFLYRNVEFTTVLAIPHKRLAKLVPESK
jgi:hypothetical protein